MCPLPQPQDVLSISHDLDRHPRGLGFLLSLNEASGSVSARHPWEPRVSGGLLGCHPLIHLGHVR